MPNPKEMMNPAFVKQRNKFIDKESGNTEIDKMYYKRGKNKPTNLKEYVKDGIETTGDVVKKMFKKATMQSE